MTIALKLRQMGYGSRSPKFKVIATRLIFQLNPLVNQLTLRNRFVKLPAYDVLNHTRVLAYGNTPIHI